MSEKHRTTCKYLKYIKHFLILVSTICSCILISAFTSLVATRIGIASSTVGLKIVTINEGIRISNKEKEEES